MPDPKTSWAVPLSLEVTAKALGGLRKPLMLDANMVHPRCEFNLRVWLYWKYPAHAPRLFAAEKSFGFQPGRIRKSCRVAKSRGF